MVAIEPSQRDIKDAKDYRHEKLKVLSRRLLSAATASLETCPTARSISISDLEDEAVLDGLHYLNQLRQRYHLKPDAAVSADPTSPSFNTDVEPPSLAELSSRN